MAIIISKNNEDSEKIDPTDFSAEKNLQEYIQNNPDAIPLYEIAEDTRLFVAAREFYTDSGPIDALGFDRYGNIYIVETKLYKNPDKRTVVAQALDYGASLWKNTISADEFIFQLNSYTQKTFNEDFAAKYADFFDLEDATENIKSIVNNLNSGNIKFVVLMDKLHDALKDLILYVNQNSKFDIYAVELEYYKHAEFEIVIPKLFGNEVKKEVVSKTNNSSVDWGEASVNEFLDDIEEQYKGGNFSQVVRNAMIELHDLCVELGNKIGKQGTYHSRSRFNTKDFRFFGFDTSAIILDSSGRFESWKNGPKHTDELRQLVINIKQASDNLGLFNADKTQNNEDIALGRSWTFPLRNSSDDDVQRFVEINKTEFGKILDKI